MVSGIVTLRLLAKVPPPGPKAPEYSNNHGNSGNTYSGVYG